MADVNANIGINIDSSNAISQLKSLQRQISLFHTSIAKSSESAAIAQRSLEKNLLNSINSIGSFSAELRTVKTTSESFTASLEGNKFSMREYFRYAGGATKTFGKLFKSEFNTISKVAEERVKKLQTQYIKMGRDATGAMKAIAVMPRSLDMTDYGTRTQVAAQKQALFNQLMKQGSTNLLNFGKNTQWAGRQLMVGFTIPLSIVGSTAAKAFMEMEVQALKFKKVYGDLFTPQAETQQALDGITELGQQFTKYGVAVSATVGLAAEAAAAGFQGLDLQRQTAQATRLSILGQVENSKALETTISLQNAFGMSSDKLADTINFLNAVENQTVVSLDDITTAIPKVAPVIQQLGGDVKDLTFFIAAMKEGGINASEGANALKSGLAALINPTKKASGMLAQFGINAKEIVVKNKGNLKATVVEFATALNQLDPLNRAQAIEQMFGKFQFARLSTLFANVAKDGNQAARVLDLANSSVEELSALSERELGMTAESSMNKFKKAVEDLKFSLIPVGQAFLEAATPIVEFVGNILEKFSDLSAGSKKAITLLVTVVGGLGPVLLMTFGLLANGVANIVKLFLTLRQGYQRLSGQSQILGEQTQYLTMEQLDAAAVAHSLDQAHARLTQRFTTEAQEIQKLIVAYQQAATAGQKFAMNNPGMMLPPRAARAPRKLAKGILSVPGPKGAGDVVPAMLSPGEAVIPSKQSRKYAPLVAGIVADNIPGYKKSNINIERSHATGSFQESSPQFQAALDMISGLRELNSKFPGIIRVVSDLTAELPFKLNQAMKQTRSSKTGKLSGGASIDEFETEYGSLSGKFLASAKRGGADISSPKMQIALKQFEEQVGKRTVALAKGTEELKVTDDIFAQATREVINEFEIMGGEAREVSAALDRSSKKVGQIRVQPSVDQYRKGLASREFRISEDRKTAKFGDINVGRPGPATKAGLQTARPASNINTKGNYTTGPDLAFPSQTMSRVGRGIPLSSGPEAFRQAQQARYAKERANFAARQGASAANQAVLATAKAAGTNSPSKRTIPIGEDIARGLEVGMANRQDEVAASGSNLGNIAVNATGGRGGKGRATRAQGAPSSEITRNASISSGTKSAMNNQATAMQQGSQRLGKFNNALMGGTFALTSLAGAGSMASGPLGNLSQQVMKFSGLLFALMSVTQLLTQTKITELATTRISTVATAMGGTGFKSLFTSTSGLGRKFLTLGKFIVRFLGPIGLAISAVTLLVAGFKFYQKKQEEARLAIEGLGDAALLSKEKLKTLGDFFGVVPTTTLFGSKTQQTGTSSVQRSQVDSLRTDKDFQSKFKNDITSLKTATDKQASLIFNSLAIQLKGQGFSKEAIDTIVKALQQEAGKTNIKFDFANIDLSTDKGMLNLQKDINDLASKVAEDLATGYSEKSIMVMDRATGKWTTFTQKIMSDKLKASLNLATKSFTGMIDGISGQLENGTITADQFSQAFARISSKIAAMPKPAQTFVLNDLLKALPESASKTAQGLQKVSDKMLLLQAQAVGASEGILGVVDAMLFLEGPKRFGPDFAKSLNENQLIVDRFRKKIEALKKALEIKSKTTTTTDPFQTTTDGKPEKTPEEAIKEKTKALKDQTTAYIKLRQAGIDSATAADLAGDSLIASAIAASTIDIATTQWQKFIKNLRIAKNESDAISAKTNLEQQIQSTNKQILAFEKLIAKGFESKRAAELVGDVNLAELILNTKTAGLTFEELVVLINKAENGLKNIKNLGNPFAEIEEQTKQFEDAFSKAMENFRIQEDQAREKFQPGIDIAQAEVDRIKGFIEVINKSIDGLQTNIKDKQRQIEIEITREIEKFQKDIQAIEDKIKTEFDSPLGKLSDESEVLSHNLGLIDHQSEAINSKYDLQVEALQKISDINSDIAAQQQKQIGLADALSRGDISAAATAAQEMRADAAARSASTQGGILDVGRKAELAALTAEGMTRLQIEKRQYAIGQEQYLLEQGRKLLQKDISDIQEFKINPLLERQKEIELEIRNIEDQIYQLENAQTNSLRSNNILLDAANIKLDEANGLLTGALALIDGQKEKWNSAKLGIDAAKSAVDMFNVSLEEALRLAEAIKKALSAMPGGLSASGVVATNPTTTGNNTVASAISAAAKANPGNGADSLQDQKLAKIAQENLLLISKIKPSALSSAESGAIGAASIAAQYSAAKAVASQASALANFRAKESREAAAAALASNSKGRVGRMYGGMIPKPMAYGGMVPNPIKTGGILPQYAAKGGKIGSDTVPAMLTPGEFVMNKASTRAYGPMLEAMNNSKYPSMRGNGFSAPTYQTSSANILAPSSVSNSTSVNNNSSSVYNYSVGINVGGSNANPQDIARAVMTQIKNVDSQRIRSQRA